ncbi:MAG: hypothetical protein J6P03_06630 [Opitutales bacterium]|nr:hypothetical protein [Opitutales bacterium]
MKKTRLLTTLLTACAILSGCVGAELDNAERLMKRPDFARAKAAAPEWCRDALKTINYLEMELESQ